MTAELVTIMIACKERTKNEIDRFYSEINKISSINIDIDTKRDNIKKHIELFTSLIKNNNLINCNSQIEKQLYNIKEEINNIVLSWGGRFQENIEQEKFRSDLSNHFIVIIFGKVKAGKSSLGNFVAKNRSKNTPIEFFKYDEAGKEKSIKELEEINDEEFKTNNLECTVEIQGFKLGGMAWIDTPGLGSMVKENGDLAKKYIQAASYVIYPTSSDAPLQRDEIDQLKELFDQNKKVTVCITKSDTYERKRKQGGGFEKDKSGKIAKFITNKSSDNRSKQENYVKSELDKILPKSKEALIGNILSISAHTAKEAIEKDDHTLLEESNILHFYQLMTKVVKEKASELMKGSPYDGLISFIDNNIIGKSESKDSLEGIKQHLNGLDSSINKQSDKFKTLTYNLNSDLYSEINLIISNYQNKISPDNYNEIFAKIDSEINAMVSNTIEDNISEMFETFTSEISKLSLILSSSNQYKVKDKIKTIKVKYDNSSSARKFGNKITRGLIKKEYKTVKKQVNLGSNSVKAVSKFKKDRITSAINQAKNTYLEVENSFINPLRDYSNFLKENMKTLEINIKKIKMELK